MRKNFTTQEERATYQCWQDMKGRCFNPKSIRYYTHGARGITVCDRWKNSFDHFLQDMGLKPDGFSIERMNNDGDYFPGNCKWASSKEQAYNRRTNVWLTFNGETLSILQWAQKLGISTPSLNKRLKKWSFADAMTKEKQTK